MTMVWYKYLYRPTWPAYFAIVLICTVSATAKLAPSLYLHVASSRFTLGEAVHSFDLGDYSLVGSNELCPFTIEQGGQSSELIVSQTIDYSAGNYTIRCVATPTGYLPTLATFHCLVVSSEAYPTVVVINVTPDLAQLAFPYAVYSGVVIEDKENALVSIGGLRITTTPSLGLLFPEYSITGDSSDSFLLSQSRVGCETFPVIHTSKALNRSEQFQHNVTLQVFSGNITANTTLRIQVLDVNDHPPVLNGGETSIMVREDTLPGTPLSMFEGRDSDSGANGDVRYSLASLSSHLTVLPFTGFLTLYRSFDHETDQPPLLTISLQDHGQPTLSTEYNITIFIDDVNESPPVIHVLESHAVVEGGSAGGLLASIEVNDSDSSLSSLSLVISSATCDCFQLSRPSQDSPTFTLSLTAPLDYESFPQGHTISLLASDNDTPTLMAVHQLVISVIDVNEPPYFPQTVYHGRIPEGAPAGTEVVIITASDPDIGASAQLLYNISSVGQYGSWLEIDRVSGVVYTTTTSTVPDTPEAIEATVTACDSADECVSATLTVTIEDQNNHRPFSTTASYNISISESLNSTDSIFVFAASDNDSMCNGGLRYSILHAEPSVFRVDSLSGALYPLNDAALDYETFQTALVVIEASDQGDRWSYSTYLTLTLQLMDMDDEMPILDTIDCPCWIMEGADSEQCQPLTAHDEDSSSLTFHILSGNGAGRFTIDEGSGMVRPQGSLNREVQEEYLLQITAFDGFRHSEPQPLTIIVTDQNDSPPTYSTPSLSIIVPRDLPVGEIVGSVAAEHNDAGYNGLTNYMFVSPPSSVTNYFGLDSLSGDLYTVQSLPNSLTDIVTVRAQDHLIPSQHDSLEVNLTVAGLVNHPPDFEVSSERILVAANHQVGTSVLELSALDVDGDDLTYSLITSTTVFTVEPTGQLTLEQSVLTLAGAEYSLNISCSDGSLRAYQQVTVAIYAATLTVGGAQFQHNSGVGPCHLTGSVPEHSDGGHVAVSLPPTQSSQSLEYSIIDSNPSAFRLSELDLVSDEGFQLEFDRRVREAFHLTLRATYGENLFYLCSVTVLIEDTNDQGPLFLEEQYSVEVYRTTPVNAAMFQLQAVDEDVGSNADTHYSLLTSNAPFTLRGPTSGVLEVSGPLSESSYTLMVKAGDAQDSSMTDTATVMITILETSNSQPMVAAPSPLTLDETAPRGPTQRTLLVTDPDRGVYGRNSFCIRSGNNHNLFSVDQSGTIEIQSSLDYEKYPQTYNLEVAVFDSSPNPQFNSATLTINIDPRNDETPVFTASTYTATVPEDMAAGTLVVTVTAIDADGDTVEYSILETSQPFTISATGKIRTTAPLNREATAHFQFTVIASDQERSSYVTVTVLVLDSNDNAPNWDTPTQTHSLFESMAPGSTLLPQLEASDIDEGANAVLWYSIVSGNEDFIFSLDPWTGTITLERSLDYEHDVKTYHLVFTVMDLGDPPLSVSSTITITYQLTNSNDNSPQFSQSLYTCTVTMDTFDPPCQVHATDADMDSVQFSVDSDHYTIDQDGVISAIVERPPSTPLIVQAKDVGTPALTSSVLVVITAQEVNNHFPNLQPPSPRLVIPESVPALSLLFFVHAEDADSGVHGVVQYNVLQGDPAFTVDNATGAVLLSQSLDYETASLHTLEVVASNPSGTSGPLNTYTIEVMDVSENTLPPLFTNDPAAILVSRGTEPGEVVATVTAVDPDPGPDGMVRYSVSGGTGWDYFIVNETTGNISVSRSLSATLDDHLSLTITAADSGSFPLSSTLSLLLLLQPDSGSKPFFLFPEFHASVPELQDDVIFSHVVALTNGDTDSDICYSIIGENEFAVNASTGAVSVRSGMALDFEEQSLYSVVLEAAKPGIDTASTALLVVNVLNVNEGRPEFPSGYTYAVDMFETYPILQEFVRAFAVDEDSELEYSIVDQDVQSPFNISQTTGGLYLSQIIQGEAGSNYTLFIQATDTDGLFRTMDITITIMAPPSVTQRPFFNPSDSIRVAEDTPPGNSALYTVELVNPDNVPVMYRIINPPTQFAIHPNSGQVYLTQALDLEDTPVHTVEIEMWDGSNTDTFTLVVLVTDVNDNRPLLTMNHFTFTVEEHSPMNYTVGTVSAFDRDDKSTANTMLNFSLVDAEHESSLELFQVREDGQLCVAGELDREAIPVHTLTVAVQDGGDPPLMGYGRITVTVMDINDHRPEFLSSYYDISIAEDVTVGTTVFTALALDLDANSYGQITYSLQSTGLPFSLDPSTGDLTVSEPLDAETLASYTLIITASDPVGVGQSSDLLLNVSILDVVDSSPSLVLSPDTAELSENLPAYTAVASVTAQGNMRPVYYSIVGGNELQHFLIETLTGVVRTSTPLDREAVSVYELTVSGAYAPGFESTVTLIVTVLDENDSPPVFPSPVLTFTMSYIAPTPLPLGVTDPDHGANAQVSVYLIPDPWAAQRFSVSPSGSLVLQAAATDLTPTVIFDLYAIDSGSPQLFSKAIVAVAILHINSSPPVFSSSEYRVTVSAPVVVGTPLFTISAAGDGEVTYSIAGGNGTDRFNVNPHTGSVAIADNFRLQSLYMLDLVATDDQGRSAENQAFIVVKECGYQGLAFAARSVTLEVTEGTESGAVVYQPDIVDLEGSSDLEFIFSIPPASSFSLNAATGTITIVGELDREATPLHQLVLQARDSTNTDRVAQVDIEVIVTDINDNSPVFLGTPYSASVVKSADIGELVTMVTAEDPDLNNNITYRISSEFSALFHISSESGAITVGSSLTGTELGSTITLTVWASDNGSPPLFSQTPVSISIADPNAPVFTQDVYTVNVSESAGRGTLVFTVHAMIASGNTGLITYSIQEGGGNALLPFYVDTLRGDVTVNDRELDYDSVQFYQVHLLATASGLTGQARLDVIVLDENDISPAFTQFSYLETITENSEPGTPVLTVVAEDGDSAPNAQVRYALAQEAAGVFLIDEDRGDITTAGAIDYEDTPRYEFTVLALDSGTPQRTGSTTVTVLVLNLNDNPPMFKQPVYNVPPISADSAVPGTILLLVQAEDRDQDELEYGLVEGPGSDNFAVNPNGFVTLNPSSINLTEFQYTLNVSACDERFCGFAVVVVEVDLGNVHNPVFNQSLYNASVVEGSTAGAFVARVFASDNDQGVNGAITYSRSSFHDGVFTIDPDSGVITTTGGLIDREATPVINMVVTARDGGGRSETANVEITVLDINDNAPSFAQQQYITNVGESTEIGTTVLTLVASDPDVGDNATVNYTRGDVDDPNQFPFDIDSNGWISVILSLDHERTPEYVFTVTATDLGDPPLTSEMVTVIIHILDILDTPAVFEQDQYNISMLEHTIPGQPIGTVQATGSECAIISYLIDEVENVPFSINSNSEDIGVIRVTQFLNRVDQDEYNFVIEAQCFPFQDSTDPIRSFASVTVHLLDVNQPPEFEEREFRASVPENLQPLSFIDGEIRAVDQDLGENMTITLKLVFFNRTALTGVPFEILQLVSDPMAGILRTTGQLDREAVSSYLFFVQATDHGSPPMSSFGLVRVRIEVTDINDSPPMFTSDNHYLQLGEDTPPGTVIFRASEVVEDQDEVGNITYTLAGGPFHIAPTGDINVTQLLDYETTVSYELLIIINDGYSTDSAILHINITDANDNRPVFDRPVYDDIIIREDVAVGTVIVTVTATDADESDNAIITYSLVDDTGGHFAINSSSGEISIAQPPDYEVPSSRRLEVRVRANDGSTETTEQQLVKVVVLVTNVNDNPPSFSQETFNFSVPENSDPGTTIGIVTATDADSEANMFDISYSISGPGVSRFVINLQKGDLETLQVLDREEQSSYQLVVTATDDGNTTLSSNVTVFVNVEDENDYTPTFPQDSYTVNVSEFLSAGQVILTVQAEDRDAGDNGDITYSVIASGETQSININDVFSLEETFQGAAALSIIEQLNHESIQSYNLTLFAADKGFPVRQTGTASILVLVVDENDNPPMFTETQYLPDDVREDVPVGTTIVTVHATDLDATDNIQLEYSIQEAGRFPELLMNSSTGDLLIAQPLDYETAQTYILTAIAQDRSGEQQEATAMVSFEVTDVNDNPPNFTNLQSTIYITENAAPGMLIDLEVEDRDSEAVSDPVLVTFSILSGNEFGRFELEGDSGVLRVLDSLDREEKESYLLVVGAEDHGTPSLTGLANISIIVEDINDNGPQTETQTVYIFLYQGQLASSLLGTVFVQDPDLHNDHHFAISSSNASNFFTIDQEGQITIVQTPPPGTYSLQVTVTDTGFPTPATTTVLVQVGNVSMDTISNSFRMQVAGVTANVFVVEKLRNFIPVVESLIVNATTLPEVALQVFGIEPSVRPGCVDVHLAAQTKDGSYVHGTLVQHVIHADRGQLEALGIEVITELVDPCATEPCESGEECQVNASYDLSHEPLGSASSVTHLGLRSSFNTTCGDLLPPCSSLACPEPSYCVEEDGVATCRDDCSSNPCKNSGNCFAQSPGYYCSCPEGFDGRNCELNVATFRDGAYAVFPSISQRSEGSISIEMIMDDSETHGLLVFSGRFNSQPGDFLTLVVSEGHPTLLVSHGEELTWTSVSLDETVNDQQWHTISTAYNSSMVSISVTTFDPYKKESRTRTVMKEFHSLDVGGPVIVGNLPEKLNYNYRERTIDPFTGCLRNLIVNTQLMDFSEPLEEEGVAGGCGFTDTHCSSVPCKHGGRCTGTWSSFLCDCTPLFAGTTCTQVSASASFTGEGFIQYEIKTTGSSRRRAVRQNGLYTTGRNFISLAFIASGNTGTLLQLGELGSTDYAILQIDQGYPQFVYDLGSGEAIARQSTVKVSDGQLHNITVQRVEQTAQLLLDGVYVARAVTPGDQATLDIPTNTIYVGGLVDSEGKVTNGFTGCVRGVKINKKDLPTFGENAEFLAMPSAVGTKEETCSDIAFGVAPTESSQQAGYVYGGLVGILTALVAVVVCFVSIMFVFRRQRRKKRNSFRVTAMGGGQSSPSALAWHPTSRLRNGRQLQEDVASEDFVLESINRASHTRQASQPTPSFTPISTPGLSQTEFTYPTEEPLPRQDSRKRLLQHQVVQQSSADPGHAISPPYLLPATGRAISPPHQPQDGRARSPPHQPLDGRAISPPHQPQGGRPISPPHQPPGSRARSPPHSRQETDAPPPPYHLRSMSGQQSVYSGRSEHSSIYNDDSEVAKYLRKQKQGADSQVEELNMDQMKPFSEEGKFEPIGSIGSLHDITMVTEEGDETISTQATLSSLDRSRVSEDFNMENYDRKLDLLVERLHNLSADTAPASSSRPGKHSTSMRLV